MYSNDLVAAAFLLFVAGRAGQGGVARGEVRWGRVERLGARGGDCVQTNSVCLRSAMMHAYEGRGMQEEALQAFCMLCIYKEGNT